ncbi:unnamed protein product, partial [Rotaria sp. Silwood1]
MPLKPNRWGHKMFVLAGGESGICYDFIFYTGKGEKSEYGFCTKIVLALCETVPHDINHKLYCDNFYTTIAFQVELFKLGIFTVGTVRSNRLAGLVMKTKTELSREAEALLKSTPLPPTVKPGRPSLKLSLVENNASTSPRAALSPLPSKSVR